MGNDKEIITLGIKTSEIKRFLDLLKSVKSVDGLDGKIGVEKSHPSFIDDLITFERFLYGERWEPKKAVKGIDLAQINDDLVGRINALGIHVDKAQVREGTPEEIKDALGGYINGEILVNPLYIDQSGKALLSAHFYDYAFSHNHHSSANVEDLQRDPVARMRHLAVDIVAHEYGHHVCRTLYITNLSRRLAENEGGQIDGHEGGYEGIYPLPLHRFDEGFALWFNATLVGHNHSGVGMNLLVFKEDDECYSDKEGIYKVYEALTKTDEAHGTKFVLDNIEQIGLPLLVDLKKREYQRMKEKYEDIIFSFGEKIITIKSTE